MSTGRAAAPERHDGPLPVRRSVEHESAARLGPSGRSDEFDDGRQLPDGAFQLSAALWDREQATVRVAEQHSDFFVRNMVVIWPRSASRSTVYRPAGARRARSARRPASRDKRSKKKANNKKKRRMQGVSARPVKPGGFFKNKNPERGRNHEGRRNRRRNREPSASFISAHRREQAPRRDQVRRSSMRGSSSSIGVASSRSKQAGGPQRDKAGRASERKEEGAPQKSPPARRRMADQSIRPRRARLAGHSVVILGGGPSLTLATGLGASPRARSIATAGRSRSSRSITPTRSRRSADVLYYADGRWWTWHKDKPEYRAFQGLRVTIEGSDGEGAGDDDVLSPAPRRLGVISRDPGTLAHGGNGGYQAINLAALAGAERIILLGYDMKHGRPLELACRASDQDAGSPDPRLDPAIPRARRRAQERRRRGHQRERGDGARRIPAPADRRAATGSLPSRARSSNGSRATGAGLSARGVRRLKGLTRFLANAAAGLNVSNSPRPAAVSAGSGRRPRHLEPLRRER
jgi:hypothetical protein